MKKTLEYLPLFTICILFFGYTNLHSYYKEFKIDIYNHISNTEIVLSFLPTIVVWATFIYGIFYQTLIQSAGKLKREDSENDENNEKTETVKTLKKKKTSRFKLIFTSFYFYFFGWFILDIIIKKILLKYYYPYELQQYNIISSFILIFIVYLTIISKKSEYDFYSENPFLVSIFIIIFISVQISYFRVDDAKMVKAGITDRIISFKYNNQLIRTYSKLVYIGQTQGSLFLYNRKTKETHIYKTSEIDSFVVKEANLQYK